MAKILKLKKKTRKTEKRARPAATTRRASKPIATTKTKVTVKAEATPVKSAPTGTKTETKPKRLPAKVKVKAETKPTVAKPKPAKVKDETKPAVKVEDQQATRVSRFGGRDLFTRLQISAACGGSPRAAPFVKAASKYLAGQHYIVENPAWAPFAPAAAGAAGALRKHVVEWWERGEEGIAAGRALDMFCKRSETPALYEYVGKYAPVPAGEIVERESAAAFSPQRRKALYDCLINLHFSPERADAFIDGEDTWELRPIKFVAYDEGLYEALQRAAR